MGIAERTKKNRTTDPMFTPRDDIMIQLGMASSIS